jgi:DNA-binding GntR family transcriptional regulator
MPQPSIYLTKADVARRHIQGLILSRAVQPGDRITTREISEALGISETPIREAIRSLASEGWLEVTSHVGAVVASAGAGQLREIYALRGLIGALAIELGGPSYDEARLAQIDANLEASAAAVEANDVVLYTRLNREFHELLYDTPQSQWCLRLDVNLSAMTAIHHGFAVMPRRMGRSLAEHKAIRDAIRRGDLARAAERMKLHEQAGFDALAKELDARTPRRSGAPRANAHGGLGQRRSRGGRTNAAASREIGPTDEPAGPATARSATR